MIKKIQKSFRNISNTSPRAKNWNWIKSNEFINIYIKKIENASLKQQKKVKIKINFQKILKSSKIERTRLRE